MGNEFDSCFLWGTLSLIIVNAGICLLAESFKTPRHLRIDQAGQYRRLNL